MEFRQMISAQYADKLKSLAQPSAPVFPKATLSLSQRMADYLSTIPSLKLPVRTEPIKITARKTNNSPVDISLVDRRFSNAGSQLTRILALNSDPTILEGHHIPDPIIWRPLPLPSWNIRPSPRIDRSFQTMQALLTNNASWGR